VHQCHLPHSPGASGDHPGGLASHFRETEDPRKVR
jgi:hypothetical protein